MTEAKSPQVLHVKNEDIRFVQMHPNAGGYASISRLLTSNNSTTVGAGIGTYDGCSIEWTVGAEEVIYVLEGVLRIRSGVNYEHVVEGRPGDLILLPKGAQVKYEGEKAKMFYALSPVNYRTYSESELPPSE